MKNNDDKEIEDFLNFIHVAAEAVKDRTEAEFDCPICGGNVYAQKSGFNGHTHAKCRNCDMVMME